MPFGGLLTTSLIGAGGSLLGGLFGGGQQSKLQQALLDMANRDAGSRDRINAETAGPLSYFYGSDPTQSGLYKDFVATGTNSTADAYNNAKASLAQKANTAGFGYSQPVTQGANAELSNEEAKAQSDVPRKALQSTIEPELSALNTRASEAKDYNPSSYLGGTPGLAAGQDSNTSSLFSSLFNTAQSGLTGILNKNKQDAPFGGQDFSF